MTTRVNERARQTQWTQRARKISASTFVCTLVFGWLTTSDASYSDLQAIMLALGPRPRPKRWPNA